jgi:hypothetical protein
MREVYLVVYVHAGHRGEGREARERAKRVKLFFERRAAARAAMEIVRSDDRRLVEVRQVLAGGGEFKVLQLPF